jgi:RNA polymerase sigma-70 factor (ECF subfamily)
MNLQELFERQHRRVYRIAMMMLNNASDAEDAVQNIFMKYIEKGIEFTDEEHEKAWFITVTKNYCKDQLKAYWNRQVDMGEIPETPMLLCP